MKYFKYRIWDGYRSKDKIKLYNEFVRLGSSFSNLYIDMCFLCELKDGRYYDLITGEEIIYSKYPYSGKLAFESYDAVSVQYVVSMLKQIQRNGIEEYKREISRMKDLALEIREESQKGVDSKEVSNDDKFVMEFVKKNR